MKYFVTVNGLYTCVIQRKFILELDVRRISSSVDKTYVEHSCVLIMYLESGKCLENILCIRCTPHA